MRDTYDADDERERFRRFLATGLRDHEAEYPQRRAWLEAVRRVTAAGVRVRRVRLVSEPVSDYIRFEHAGAGATIESGEDLRWLPHVPDLIAAARSVETSYAEWRRQLRAGVRLAQAARLPVYERTRLFRLYEPALVPGLLQTAQYAAAVIESFLAFTQAARDVNEAVAARMEWQKIIYGDRKFRVILEEQALRTQVGSPETMSGQLDRLLAVMTLPSVSLALREAHRAADTLISEKFRGYLPGRMLGVPGRSGPSRWTT